MMKAKQVRISYLRGGGYEFNSRAIKILTLDPESRVLTEFGNHRDIDSFCHSLHSRWNVTIVS